jgi:carbon-monoxide dehydrogenase medium subunit
MRTFDYERPDMLADALALMADADGAARPLAGGTDLIIRIRDGSIRPRTVVDVKGIAEFSRDIRIEDGWLRIGARTTMTDLLRDERIRRDYSGARRGRGVRGLGPDPESGDARRQHLQRVAGRRHGAGLARFRGPGRRGRATWSPRDPLDDFFVRSGVTTLAPGELVEAIEMPVRSGRRGSVHARRTRRRGHDLASVTLAVAIDEDGVTRVSYGSVGPRPVLAIDDTGLLADPAAGDDAVRDRLDELFAAAAPSPTSMRASPEYRLAMLRVMGLRAVQDARKRIAS